MVGKYAWEEKLSALNPKSEHLGPLKATMCEQWTESNKRQTHQLRCQV